MPFIYKKLKNEPLKEAIFELRFETALPSNVLFGIIYQSLTKDGEKFQAADTPFVNIPEQIRNSDPNLDYQILHQLIKDDFIIGVGRKNIVFTNKGNYAGWSDYSQFIKKSLTLMNGIFEKYTRISMRYINVIDDSLFSATNCKLEINDYLNTSTTSAIRTEIEKNSNIIILQLNNNVMVSVNGEQEKKASIIDIDVLNNFEILPEKLKENSFLILESLHNEVVSTFFSLLNEQYLKEKLISIGERYES